MSEGPSETNNTNETKPPSPRARHTPPAPEDQVRILNDWNAAMLRAKIALMTPEEKRTRFKILEGGAQRRT